MVTGIVLFQYSEIRKESGKSQRTTTAYLKGSTGVSQQHIGVPVFEMSAAANWNICLRFRLVLKV